MRHLQSIILFILLFFSSIDLYSQSLQKLKSLILNADSVILTSHTAPLPVVIKGQNKQDYKLVVNNQVNLRFIKERRKINDAAIKELATFLCVPFRDSIFQESKCFFYPHHSIYIYHKGILSHIHICFQCEDIECSPDIEFPENDFDQETWKKMKSFLKSEGLNYGFNAQDL